MNKRQELKSLTWKYFWKRKRQEVWEFIESLWDFIKDIWWGLLTMLWFFSLVIVPGLPVGSVIRTIGLSIACAPLLLFMVWVSIHILYFIPRDFIRWLRQNWKLATKDATLELKRRRKK